MTESEIDRILDEVERLDREGKPGPWRWWTSCSCRRLSSDATGKDGDVLHGAFQRHDGQPDVVCADADKELIATYRSAAPALAAEVRRLRAMLGTLQGSVRALADDFGGRASFNWERGETEENDGDEEAAAESVLSYQGQSHRRRRCAFDRT